MTSLAGKTVFVTGASSGIGEAMAVAAAAAGATAIAAARRVERLDALVKRIADDGGTAVAVELDVTDDASIERAMGTIAERFGRLDVLVNCAGVMGRGGGIYTDTSLWTESIATNLLGVMLVTRAALPILTAPGGHIVNVSSTATRGLSVGSAPYSASKAGVNAFTDRLRRELVTEGIRVSVVSPGLVDTEFASHAPDEATKQRYQRWFATMHALTGADVANAIVELLVKPPHVSISEVVMRPTDQDD